VSITPAAGGPAIRARPDTWTGRVPRLSWRGALAAGAGAGGAGPDWLIRGERGLRAAGHQASEAPLTD